MTQTAMSYIAKALFFAGGFAVGLICGVGATKKKFEKRIECEIADVKKAAKKAEENSGLHVEAKCSQEVVDFVKRIDTLDFKASDEDSAIAYDISIDEFGEMEEYSTHTLYYYTKDKKLVDEDDNVVDDIEEIIGNSLMNEISSSGAEHAFVRNDRKKSDYEIVICKTAFSTYMNSEYDGWDDDG